MLFILMAIACNNNRQSAKKIFRYNEQAGIASLDPAFAKNQSIMWAVHQLYSTLLEVDSAMQLRPILASRWEADVTNTLYTFYLRTDVFFHDDACFADGKGRKLTAADVLYSFNRLIDKSVASPGSWIFNSRVDTVQPFKALNDSVFQLKLLRPFQPILGILSMQYCSIVPHEAVEKYGEHFRSHPVGTGPFQLVRWAEGQAMVLKRHTNYFEQDENAVQLPYLDGIKISFFDSKATEFLEFRQGRLDFVNDIEASFKDEVLTKTGSLKKVWTDKVVLQKHPYLNIEYLGILVEDSNPLVKSSPLRLKKIRQAINYAFDRRKMMLYLRNSIGIAAESGFVPQGMPGFNADAVKGYTYRPDVAKRLLQEAGYGNGRSFPVVKLYTVPVYADLAGYIANELLQAGIRVEVEVMQKSVLLEQTAKSQALFFRASWIADYPDAENYLSVFYGKNPAPPNYTRYQNSQFDVLYERAVAETNDSLRYLLYQQMDKLILADAPVVPLWYDMAIHLVQPYVKGLAPNSLNLLELRKVRIEK
ncbi:MAG TPA: ABC transporter substrate-binding protein [Ferruginibacter sp.]|nr:ABC transporter substrate-binding protein [Ferruginibacter sp.]HMP21188.1 ABC transporter substrate-binding protein [Ferruginibacter sp.]